MLCLAQCKTSIWVVAQVLGAGPMGAGAICNQMRNVCRTTPKAATGERECSLKASARCSKVSIAGQSDVMCGGSHNRHRAVRMAA